MKDVPTKTNSVSLYQDSDYNDVFQDVFNGVRAADITLLSGDLDQFAKAASAFCSSADFFVDNGSTTAYVLSPLGDFPAPGAYVNGMRVRFVPTATNSGSPTVSVGALPGKKVHRSAGSTGTENPGPIQAGKPMELWYNLSIDAWIQFPVNEVKRMLSGTIAGVDATVGSSGSQSFPGSFRLGGQPIVMVQSNGSETTILPIEVELTIVTAEEFFWEVTLGDPGETFRLAWVAIGY